MWMIAGLGNPGAQYELTRHNVGFLVIDHLKNLLKVNFNNNFHGLCAKTTICDNACLLIKPQTFMNKSGLSVQAASSFYKILPQNIIVIHDELDVQLGEIRLKLGGGNNGHNGLKDISARLGNDYLRVRIGISRPVIKGTEADFVLNNFNDSELITLEKIIPLAAQAIMSIIKEGLDKTNSNIKLKI